MAVEREPVPDHDTPYGEEIIHSAAIRGEAVVPILPPERLARLT